MACGADKRLCFGRSLFESPLRGGQAFPLESPQASFPFVEYWAVGGPHKECGPLGRPREHKNSFLSLAQMTSADPDACTRAASAQGPCPSGPPREAPLSAAAVVVILKRRCARQWRRNAHWRRSPSRGGKRAIRNAKEGGARPSEGGNRAAAPSDHASIGDRGRSSLHSAVRMKYVRMCACM